ncbi:MAG: hypothetical protein WD042_10730 [Phycisphaeraceae bacterium]
MSDNAVQLLRMLEPAVRPGGLPGPARTPSTLIEDRSFDSILDEVRAMNQPEQDTSGSQAAASPGPEHKAPGLVQLLGGVDRIENASLRTIVGTSSSSRF